MTGAGALLQLLRDNAGLTRAEIVQRSGLSRVTVGNRLAALVESGYVTTQSEAVHTRGRPAEVFRINADLGWLIAADIGSSHTRLGLARLTGEVVHHVDLHLHVEDGPDSILGTIQEQLRHLMTSKRIYRSEILALGIGVPGPVEYSTGKLVSPPTMTGWDGADVRSYFEGSFGAPTQVDKDANIMALGVHRVLRPAIEDVLLVKVGTGLSCGIISRGQILRGAHGAAGDLGHIPREGGELCRCGQYGCAEATAGGWAIAARLRELGHHGVHTSADIVSLAARRNGDALAALRAAGRRIGEVVSDAIGVVNPSLVTVGGNLALADEPLMAGIRERVYQRSHPLATRDLQIITSPLGAEAGLRGAAYLASDLALAPTRVDAATRIFAQR